MKIVRYAALTTCLACLLGAWPFPAQAQSTDDEIRQLREQILALSKRLDQLEENNRELRATKRQLAETSQAQASRMAEVSQQTEAAAAQLYDDLQVGIGLASGSDDPVSTSQPLGGGRTTEPLGIDLAYFE